MISFVVHCNACNSWKILSQCIFIIKYWFTLCMSESNRTNLYILWEYVVFLKYWKLRMDSRTENPDHICLVYIIDNCIGCTNALLDIHQYWNATTS